MRTLLKRFKNRVLSIFLGQRQQAPAGTIADGSTTSIQHQRITTDAAKASSLLPAHKPLFARLRPGLHHCQIHDPKYLSQILAAELEADPSAPSANGSIDP
jgi:hypothetical protein